MKERNNREQSIPRHNEETGHSEHEGFRGSSRPRREDSGTSRERSDRNREGSRSSRDRDRL